MTTTASKTFRTFEKSRGCDEFGGYSLVRTETVHENGLVEWSVRGWSQDDGTIDQRGTRQYEGPLDLSKVEGARLSGGWALA